MKHQRRPHKPTHVQVDRARRPPGGPEPALPHERDEMGSMTDGVSSPKMEQAARDMRRGPVDTSRAPEADAAYRKIKR